MATTGMQAYRTHFLPLIQNGQVDTQIKPTTANLRKYGESVGVATVWEANDPTQQITGLTLPEYTCVVFINEAKFDPKKVLIRIKHTHRSLKANTEVRVDIDRLVKPGAGSGSLSGRLKPQKVGLDESLYSLQRASDSIIESIVENNTIPAEIKSYIIDLFWYTSGYRGKKSARFPDVISTSELKKAKDAIDPQMWRDWKSTIQNDFGEVLGPFALYSYTLMDTASYNTIIIPPTCRAWWPARPNEKLLDFGIFLHPQDTKGKMMRFSSKAGDGATNTVKSEDITGLLKEKRNKEWDSSPEYKIFDILTKNVPTLGAILAVQFLMTTKRSLVSLYDWPGSQAVARFKSNSAPANSMMPMPDWQAWSAFARNTRGDWGTGGNPLRSALVRGEYFKKEHGTMSKKQQKGGKIAHPSQLTKENIRYACEVILRQQCHEGSAVSMNKIFAAAIRGKVWYIKFKIGNDGVPTGLWQNTGWKVERDNDYKTSGDVCFRTQNQLDSQKGKIGIDPKVSKVAVNA